LTKTVGILGGGQLGRMLAVAASRLGIKTHIFEPLPDPPAGDTATKIFSASYEDNGALVAFAKSVDVITYEFENIPTKALDALEKIKPVFPQRIALATSQDRLVEKQFLESIGLYVAPYAPVDTLEQLEEALETLGTPCILKTRRFGYDGKGQIRIETPGQAKTAFSALDGQSAVLEKFVRFEREISVIAARSTSGEITCFDPGENVHINGILHTTTVPAALPNHMQTDAVLLAAKILNALDYVGVMGVELFVGKNGLLVNEIAPRVHNSGHWTQNACLIDQFEQHIRAIFGLPLGNGQRHSDAIMTNLIGDDINHLEKHDNFALHLYGKSEVKAGRKMGHIIQLSPKSS